MKKVAEEFLLSLIFVGKWLVLGLGIVGILYVAISLAYHKSYHDPRMDQFDLDIAESIDKKNRLEETRETLTNGMDATNNEIEKLEENDLPNSDRQIESIKLKISDLGLKWWDRLPIPMLEKDEAVEEIYQELDDANNNRTAIVYKIEVFKNDRDKSIELISGISKEIRDYEIDISELKNDKKRAQVDVKGPMIWLLSMLGLT
jgi:chromosome segregation ATPase